MIELKISVRFFFYFLVAGSAPLAVSHASVEPGFQQTFGSHHYHGTKASLDIGGKFHIKPMIQAYHSDDATGTYKTVSARFAYDEQMLGAGVTLGVSPEEDGYKNIFVGLDGSMSFDLKNAPALRFNDEPARLSFGAGFKHITHTDEFQAVAVSTSSPSGRVRRRPRAIDIGQSDLTLSSSLSAFESELECDITKSYYDRDLENISARAAQISQLEGLNSLIQGFPDSSFHVRFELDALPVVAPYVSFTRTTFELDVPTSNATTVGAMVTIGEFTLDSSYESYDPGGEETKLSYVSVSVTAKF